MKIFNQLNLKKKFLGFILAVSLLTSCSGSIISAALDSGVGGTGIIMGIITGFGSVYVNGIKFEVDNSSFDVDGNLNASQSKLSKGMLVTINGTINEDGVTGTATNLVYDDNIEGPISSAPSIISGSNNQQKTFEILGNTIIIDAISTYYEDTNFNDLAKDDVVEISGYITDNNTITATLVKQKDPFVAGSTVVELKGTISNLNLTSNSFELSGIVINYTSSTELELDGNILSNSLYVEVEGILEPDNSISADEIEIEENELNDEDFISISGIISDYVDDSNFKVNGQLIDASSAQEFEPSNALSLLENGIEVEIEGSLSNGILMANEVELELNDIEISALIQSIGIDRLELSFPNVTETITVMTNNSTQFEDSSSAEVDNLNLTLLNTNDYVKIEASIINNLLTASKVKRDDVDDYVLQGQIESTVPNNSVTILGVTFNVDTSTIYDGFTDATDFFISVSVDDFIRVKDTDGNGIIDEISQED